MDWRRIGIVLHVVVAVAASGCGSGRAPEGTDDTPGTGTELTVGVDREFTAINGISRYQFITGAAGVYAIGADRRLSGQTGTPFSGMFWQIYATPAFTHPLFLCGDFYGGVANELCALTLAGNTTYHLEVNGFGVAGDRFSLGIRNGGPVTDGEGSGLGAPGMPVEIPDDAVTITPGHPAYTRFHSSGEGNLEIRLAPENSHPHAGFADVSAQIHSDIDFEASDSIVKSCNRYKGPRSETCILSALPEGEWYLRVEQRTGLPVAVRIAVTNYGTRTNQGTPETPVAIDLDTPHTGQVASNGTSVYQFRTTATGRYTATLSNTRDLLSLAFANAAGDPLPPPDDDTGIADPFRGVPTASVSADLEADTLYDVLVSELLAAGSDFTLEVTH